MFEVDGGCRLRADIITCKGRRNRLYLIKLYEDWDSIVTFHLKSFSDFMELDTKLRPSSADQSSATKASLSSGLYSGNFGFLPDLHASSRFGIRTAPRDGKSRFLDKQHEAAQNYLDAVLARVPSIAADSSVQAFFAGTKTQEGKDMLDKMILESRFGINLRT